MKIESHIYQISDIRSRGKLPILVGGTHYYTQSLLFEDILADAPIIPDSRTDDKHPEILNEPTEVILQKLKEIDPIMAERWHPNERRKIQRSLEIYLKTGKPASQLYSEQRTKRDPNQDPDETSDTEESKLKGFTLRFPTLLFWVHCSKDSLHPRLNSRILKMLDRGLLSEVQHLSSFRLAHESRTHQPIDQTRGIWVSIGYKEFLEYQAALTSNDRSEAELEKLKNVAIEKTQAATRQYATRQIRWIRIKLLNALSSTSQPCTPPPHLFLLDGSDLSTWTSSVLSPALTLTAQFLAGETLPNPLEMSDAAKEMLMPKRNYDLSQRPDLWQKRVCEVCGTVSVTENDWGLHVRSRGHRRAVGVKKKEANKREMGKERGEEKDVDVLDYLGSLDGEGGDMGKKGEDEK